MKNVFTSLLLLGTISDSALAQFKMTAPKEIQPEIISVSLKVDSISEFKELNQASIENPRLELSQPYAGINEIQIYNGDSEARNVCFLLGYKLIALGITSTHKISMSHPISMVWNKDFSEKDALSILTNDEVQTSTVLKTVRCQIK